MDSKAFTVVFIAITVIAVIGIIISRMMGNTATPNPSATPSASAAATSSAQTGEEQNPPQPKSPAANGKKTYTQAPPALSAVELKNKKAVIATAKGNIEFEIYPEATQAASNFIFLSNEGFYDNLTFHRVEPNFVIQGGDPLGTGAGGPGYTFTESKLIKTKYDKGIVAMAKRADEKAGTGGSQFFIMLADTPLPPDYVIFGKVLKGQDVVSKIVKGDVMTKVSIEPIK